MTKSIGTVEGERIVKDQRARALAMCVYCGRSLFWSHAFDLLLLLLFLGAKLRLTTVVGNGFGAHVRCTQAQVDAERS